jgi:hypothetical protein
MGFGNPSQPKQEPANPTLAIGGVPPPIPTSSRPDLAALQASKPTSNGTSAPSLQGSGAGSCLHCRDFSGPDNHAARFSRESIPSTDIGWLAHQLTSPFPSKTDKARVIFAWLHHNVAYDVVAFYNNAVKSSTPQSTMASGLAVCEGYAGLFAALGVKAGLEVIVVSGGSKGYGHTQVQPGEAIPPFKSTHAWNAGVLATSRGPASLIISSSHHITLPSRMMISAARISHLTTANSSAMTGVYRHGKSMCVAPSQVQRLQSSVAS